MLTFSRIIMPGNTRHLGSGTNQDKCESSNSTDLAKGDSNGLFMNCVKCKFTH